jgi:hypothetical protein
MSQKLKDVELVSDAQSGERLFGLSGDEIIDNGFEEQPPLVDEPTSKIIVPASRSTRVKKYFFFKNAPPRARDVQPIFRHPILNSPYGYPHGIGNSMRRGNPPRR